MWQVPERKYMDLTNNEFDFIKQLLHLIFTCDTVDEIKKEVLLLLNK